MASAAQVKQQVEAALAAKGNLKLELSPRLVCEGYKTGDKTLDSILPGGFPVAGTTEIVGSRSSGRATLAAAYIAQRTREGLVCAWIDVAGDMCPEAMLANGADMERILWIRCGRNLALPALRPAAVADAAPMRPPQPSQTVGPAAKPDLRPYNPRTSSFGRDRSIGTPGAPNRPLMSKLASERVEQPNSDRMPSRRGKVATHTVAAQHPIAAKPIAFTAPAKPWSRLEQAIQSVDLLVQGGGFAAIVLDLGSIDPKFAQRIPIATWFRWRAALERTRTSLVVLSQCGRDGTTGCTGSSAEMIMRVQADLPPAGTVLNAIPYRLQVVRRRFDEAPAYGARKQPAQASAWESRATWAAS